jgi:hypothetical protein
MLRYSIDLSPYIHRHNGHTLLRKLDDQPVFREQLILWFAEPFRAKKKTCISCGVNRKHEAQKQFKRGPFLCEPIYPSGHVVA